MVTPTRTLTTGFRAYILTALMLATCTSLYAKRSHAYVVSIKLHVGGAPIMGFLYSVNDTAMTIIPGGGGPKVLRAALERPRPISIPLSLIKKVSISRVRSFARLIAGGLVIFGAYSVAYMSFIPFKSTPDVVVYAATVTTATILTGMLLYVRRYKPTEPGFTITMQKYCLAKAGATGGGQ